MKNHRRWLALLGVVGVLFVSLLVRWSLEPSGVDQGALKPQVNAGVEPLAGAGEPRDVAGKPAAEKDFRRLAEAAMRIRDDAQRQAALTELLVEWLTVDPAGVEKYIMWLEVKSENAKLDVLASALSSALASMDERVASSEAVKASIRRLILHLARLDPDTALDWASRWLDRDTREAVSVDIARTLAGSDPRRALDLAAQMTSPLRRMQSYAVIGSVWARSDPTAALSWAANLSSATERAMALNAALAALAQADPEAAAQRVASAERAMAEEYEERYRNDLAAMGLTEADLANDREKYLELLAAGEVPPPTSSDVELMADAARVAAQKLALERPEAAIAWAEALDNQILWLNAIKGAVAGWGQVDPAAAVDYVAANHPQYPELLTALYDVWAASDPAQAAAGTRLLEDASLRAAATDAVTQAWAANDPVQAAAWVDTLPAAERTDAVLLAVVTGLSAVDPIAAWTRAQAIQDPSIQYRGLKAAFSTIVTRQPDVARDLLASATLSDTATERLQDLLAAVGRG